LRKPAKLPLITFILFALIILLPPLIYGYVYPNTEDDSAVHLAIIEALARGEEVTFGYPGQAIIAYPIAYLSNWFNLSINVLFLWFNYIALIGVGLTFFYILSKLVNKVAGLLAIPLVIFCTPSTLTLFECGTIFHLINTCIILPWAIYFLIEWLQHQKPHQATTSLALILAFSAFHPSSIYLPYTVGLFLVLLVAYKLKQKKRLEGARIFTFGLIAVGLGFMLSSYLLPTSNLTTEAISTISGQRTSQILPPTISSFSVYYLGLMVLVILILTIITVATQGKITLPSKSKLMLLALGSLSIPLALVTFTGISSDPLRTSMDLSIYLTVAVTIVAGLVLAQVKRSILTYTTVPIVALGVILTLTAWVGYNSSITKADIQAIDYIDGLGGNTYNCSTQVAPWIYDRFTDKTYSPSSSLMVYRNLPMTPRTNPDQYHYQYNHVSQLEDFKEYEVIRIFEEGKVKVYVLKQPYAWELRQDQE